MRLAMLARFVRVRTIRVRHCQSASLLASFLNVMQILVSRAAVLDAKAQSVCGRFMDAPLRKRLNLTALSLAVRHTRLVR